MVLKQAGTLGAIGGVIGWLLAGGIGTLAQSLLVGVPPIDPIVVRWNGAAVRGRAGDRGVDAGDARGRNGSGHGAAGGVDGT